MISLAICKHSKRRALLAVKRAKARKPLAPAMLQFDILFDKFNDIYAAGIDHL
jgi:hypothetical protein